MQWSPRDHYGVAGGRWHHTPQARPDPYAHRHVRRRFRAVLSASEVLPRLTPGAFFTQWSLAPLPVVVTVWACGLYLLGVARLRRRGDAWPLGRTVAFVGVGMGSFCVATSSGLAAYDTTLVSVHMVQHMVLSMVVPLFLALGAPVTLALRTLPAPAAPVAARACCTRGSPRCCRSRR